LYMVRRHGAWSENASRTSTSAQSFTETDCVRIYSKNLQKMRWIAPRHKTATAQEKAKKYFTLLGKEQIPSIMSFPTGEVVSEPATVDSQERKEPVINAENFERYGRKP
uniref:Uncharacterized protein n=1 Tax=Echeneis naucrates TaxID=173247 RepID=A0A665X0F1_ECHNA